jgi:hypothetical protein
MTGPRIQHIFKLFSKMIRLAEIGVADASGLKSHMVAVSDQFGQQGGGLDLYDDLTTVVMPLTTRIQAAAAALDRVPTLAKASAEIYVRVIGSEIGEPATASPATILNALKAQMALAGQTIYPSGTVWNYFNSNFAFNQFPTSLTPSIPDSWVSSVVIV